MENLLIDTIRDITKQYADKSFFVVEKYGRFNISDGEREIGIFADEDFYYFETDEGLYLHSKKKGFEVIQDAFKSYFIDNKDFQIIADSLSFKEINNFNSTSSLDLFSQSEAPVQFQKWVLAVKGADGSIVELEIPIEYLEKIIEIAEQMGTDVDEKEVVMHDPYSSTIIGVQKEDDSEEVSKEEEPEESEELEEEPEEGNEESEEAFGEEPEEENEEEEEIEEEGEKIESEQNKKLRDLINKLRKKKEREEEEEVESDSIKSDKIEKVKLLVDKVNKNKKRRKRNIPKQPQVGDIKFKGTSPVPNGGLVEDNEEDDIQDNDRSKKIKIPESAKRRLLKKIRQRRKERVRTRSL